MRLFKALLLLVIGLVLFSCVKEDQATSTFIMPFDIQYQREIVGIEKFLDEYQMKVDPANIENITFEKLVAPIDPSKSIRVEHASNLTYKMVKSNGVNYKVYYIKLREGDATQQNPIFVDSVLVNYRGLLLNKRANYDAEKSFEANQTFDSKTLTPSWFPLTGVVEGWRAIFQMFKPGTFTVNSSTNDVTFNDFGVGVMFLPSGLGYYAESKGSIPAYSPLIFTFSLKGMERVDSDSDGIDTINEDVNGNGKYGDDDTDGDTVPNYLDIDDDGDGKLTKAEIKYSLTLNGITNYYYYPFNGAAVDDPDTPYDDRRGIPRKFTGPLTNPSLPESASNPRLPNPDESDFTANPRLRKHLDKTVQ